MFFFSVMMITDFLSLVITGYKEEKFTLGHRVLICSHLTLLFWTCDKTVPHGVGREGEHLVEQNYLTLTWFGEAKSLRMGWGSWH